MATVGNKALLSYDDTWDQLLIHYSKKQCIVEGSQFPPN